MRPPIVLVDPRLVAEELRGAFREAVSPQKVAETLAAMMEAMKLVSTKDGGELQPDWTAREKAIRLWIDTLVGRPRQEVFHTVEPVAGKDETDFAEKLRNPFFARALLQEMAKHLPPEEAKKLAEETLLPDKRSA